VLNVARANPSIVKGWQTQLENVRNRLNDLPSQRDLCRDLVPSLTELGAIRIDNQPSGRQ